MPPPQQANMKSRGSLKFPCPIIDNKIVYLPLDICQELYNAENNLTSLALAVEQ